MPGGCAARPWHTRSPSSREDSPCPPAPSGGSPTLAALGSSSFSKCASAWPTLPHGAADDAPAFNAARCAIEQADWDASHGIDPSETLEAALPEMRAVASGDADALALIAQGHLTLAEWKRARSLDAEADRGEVVSRLAEELAPENAEVLIVLGRWKLLLGEADEARAAWEAARNAAYADPRPRAYIEALGTPGKGRVPTVR